MTMADIDGHDPGYLYGGNRYKHNTEYVKKRHGAYVFIKNVSVKVCFSIFCNKPILHKQWNKKTEKKGS